MRKGRFAAGALVAAAVLASLLGTTVPVSSQIPPVRTVLRIFETNEGAIFQDVNEAPRGDWGGAGDWTVNTQKLLDPQTCERVGTNVGRFTVVRHVNDGALWVIADITSNLEDGRITIYGSFKTSEFSDESGVDHAVTGGTRTYRDATGEVVVKPARRCEQRGTLYRFDLLL